ncbi:MAG: hypothetical protein ACUVWR_11495 [Anaerolineae bacterium]
MMLSTQSRHSLKDVGWVWDGQGFVSGPEPVLPSIFGAGEGPIYFGLRRVAYFLHPNSDLAMQKMSGLEEVICDIAKWGHEETGPGSFKCYVDSKFSTVVGEASKVSQLSLKYPNITGAIHDDMLGLIKREGYTPEQYVQVKEALHSANPKLKLWAVVYTHELDAANWAGFLPYIDIVSLWVWRYFDLPKMEESIKLCREIFPDRPLNLGCYLRDYVSGRGVPMEWIRYQWELIPEYLDSGLIDGFSILGNVTIDAHTEQAAWIREFIASH